LFWKKPKPAIDNNDPLETKDQREAFRYIFKGDRSLAMDFKGKPVRVINISAGGMAFRDEGFTRYDADQIHLHFDIPNYRGETLFSAQLRILDISNQGICHSIFENCTIQEYEIIHKYVLEMQKKDMTATSRNKTTQNNMTQHKMK